MSHINRMTTYLRWTVIKGMYKGIYGSGSVL
jgi:hypothetical protein